MTASKANRRRVSSRPEGEAERFDPARDGPELAYEHVHRYALAAKALHGLRVLDLASGSGFGSRLLEAGGCDVTAVDLERTGLVGMRSAAVCDVQGLPFRSESFDAVVCFEAIEHVEAPERLVAEVARVLRAPAIFLVSTPDREIYTDRAGHKNPFHVAEMTRSEFESLLESRFDRVRIAGQGLWAGSWISPLPDSAQASGSSGDVSPPTAERPREIAALTLNPALGGTEFQVGEVDRPSARWALAERSELPVPVYLLGLCSATEAGASRIEAALATDSILHDPAQWLLGRYERLSDFSTGQNRVLEAEIERARLEHIDLSSQLDAARIAIEKHAREADTARASMHELETQVEQARRVIDERHAELAQAQAGAADLAGQLEAARALHAESRRQIEQAAASITGKDDEVTRAGRIVEDKQDELAAARSTITHFEKELDLARSVIDQYAAERDRAAASSANLESQVAAARTANENMESQIAAARKVNRSLEAQLEKSRAAHRDYDRRLEQAAAGLAAKHEDFLRIRQTVEGKEAELARARDVIETKDTEIAAAEAALAVLEAEADRFWARLGRRLSQLFDRRKGEEP